MSRIEWTDETWNPTVGCSRVSPGCEHCYAERVAHREMQSAHQGLTVAGPKGPRWNGTVRLLPERLETPLRWRKPRRVFVNSMSDLFHEAVPFDFVDRVFSIMAITPQHTYQVLTKRPDRMRAYAGSNATLGRIAALLAECTKGTGLRVNVRNVRPGPGIEYPNVWLGTSVEDQARADERIPHLLATPAAVRFLSVEPLLERVLLRLDGDPLPCQECDDGSVPPWGGYPGGAPCLPCEGSGKVAGPSIDWIIVGGESGPGARPCNVEWIRSIVSQSKLAGVPVFVKQLGAVPLIREALGGTVYERGIDAMAVDREWPCGTRFGNPTGQTSLNGRVAILKHRKGNDPEEWPVDLRVREHPQPPEEAP